MTDKKGTILQTLKRLGWIYCHICGVLLILGIIFLWAVLNGWGGFVRPICPLGQGAYDEIKGVCRPECADVTAKGVCLNHSLKCSLFTHENCEADEQDTAAYRLVENKKSFLGRAKTVFAHKNKVLKTKEALLLMNVSQNRKNFPPFLWVQKEGRFFMVKAYVNEDGALLDNPMALTCEQGQGLVYCFKQ